MRETLTVEVQTLLCDKVPLDEAVTRSVLAKASHVGQRIFEHGGQDAPASTLLCPITRKDRIGPPLFKRRVAARSLDTDPQASRYDVDIPYQPIVRGGRVTQRASDGDAHDCESRCGSSWFGLGPSLFPRHDYDISIERIGYGHDRAQLRIGCGSQETPHAGRVLVDHPRQLCFAEGAVGAESVELVDDAVDRRDGSLLTLNLSLDLRILGNSTRQTTVMMARLGLLLSACEIRRHKQSVTHALRLYKS